MRKKKLFILILILLLFISKIYSNNIPFLSININDGEDPNDLVSAIKIIVILSIITLSPAILLLMSSFTRIIIVLVFLRQALGSPTMPPNQVLTGLALFITYFVMSPILNIIYQDAVVPYMDKQITIQEALAISQKPLKNFMLNHVTDTDIKLFSQEYTKENSPMSVLVPSFVISELKSAFQIGFLVYLPFIIIDMIVSSVLMAMGMMMLPPTVISLPIKMIVFVLIDGWRLLIGSLVQSFIT